MVIRNIFAAGFLFCLSGLSLHAELSEEQRTLYALNATRIFCQVLTDKDFFTDVYEGRSMMQCASCHAHRQNIALVMITLSAAGFAALIKELPVSQEVENLVTELQALKAKNSFELVQAFCVKAANLLSHPCLDCNQKSWVIYTDPNAT